MKDLILYIQEASQKMTSENSLSLEDFAGQGGHKELFPFHQSREPTSPFRQTQGFTKTRIDW